MSVAEPLAAQQARTAQACREGRATAQLGEGDSPLLWVTVVEPITAEPLDGLERALEALRQRSARPAVRALGRDEGYRIEDMAAVSLRVPPGVDAARAEGWLRRRLGRACALSSWTEEGPWVLSAAMRPRQGFSPRRHRYGRDAQGRVQVEAFEIHVAEHCNLRCANCCNMSPFVAEQTLSVERIAAICDRMRGALHAEVIKIMGGEPLLHPQIVQVLGVLRDSGLGDRVRLFTNGLRLKSMPEAFWGALDEMTISNYASAPVREPILALARERSRRHGFVLNVKPVTEFSQVLDPRFSPGERAQETFERCWLRHRCLIVRGDRFYMCTRAAYAPDFLARVEHEAAPPGVEVVRTEDGVELEGKALADRLEDYLNRDAHLGACHYCRGGDGPTIAHHQLTRPQVRAGVLSAGPEREP